MPRVRARVPQPRAEHAAPDGHDHQPGRQREPGVEILGQHVLRQRERHEPEREHADRVGDRDRRRRAPRHDAALPRVPTRYAATIAFPWPGDSACSAPQPNAPSSRRTSTPRPEAASSNRPARPSDRVPLSISCAAARRRGAMTVPLPAGYGEGGLALVERALKQVFRVAAQAVRGVAARRGRADCGALAGRGHDGLPADAVGEGAVVELDAPRVVERRAAGRAPAGWWGARRRRRGS